MRVLSCGDTELSMQWTMWQQQTGMLASEYHDDITRLKLAREHGAAV